MMAYTGLFNVFTDPGAYTGKVIKLKGQFDCAEDYPAVGADITVAGRFEMYQEGEDVFAHLVDADIM